MNILHYSLGFPPFRRGGMTQYCLDLIAAQAKIGHKVALLWPGRLYNLGPKSKIEKKQRYNLEDDLFCESYELFNPLPVPLMDGIRIPEMYLIEKEKETYKRFFRNHTFQVLHIHTFMGLPAEIIEAAQEASVKVVFTSHDYFPICPRVILFHNGENCNNNENCSDCVNCNSHGLSLKKMQILQSDFYRRVKENTLVKVMRKQHNRKMYDTVEQTKEKTILDEPKRREYQELRQKNLRILENLDIIHFNSENTLQVYRNHGYSGENAAVISISHGAIGNHKQKRTVCRPVRFGYMGPLTTHKGYGILRAACDDLWAGGQHNFQVHIFEQLDNIPPYVVCHSPYKYEDLPAIMNLIDVDITPSEWVETFGFNVLEALSYGVPVITTDRVGAKDLVENGQNGYVIKADKSALENIMNHLIQEPEKIETMNKYIIQKTKIKTMSQHSKEIEMLYQR